MADTAGEKQRRFARHGGQDGLRRLARHVRDYIERRGVEGRCHVSMSREGRWFVLTGDVDSQGTKSALISLVPRVDGAQWVVDRIRVRR